MLSKGELESSETFSNLPTENFGETVKDMTSYPSESINAIMMEGSLSLEAKGRPITCCILVTIAKPVSAAFDRGPGTFG